MTSSNHESPTTCTRVTRHGWQLAWIVVALFALAMMMTLAPMLINREDRSQPTYLPYAARGAFAAIRALLVIYLVFGSGRFLNRLLLFSFGTCIVLTLHGIAFDQILPEPRLPKFDQFNRELASIRYTLIMAIGTALLRPAVGPISKGSVGCSISISDLLILTFLVAFTFAFDRWIVSSARADDLTWINIRSMILFYPACTATVLVALSPQFLVRVGASLLILAAIYGERIYFRLPNPLSPNVYLLMWSTIIATLATLRYQGFQIRRFALKT